jgi:hypothetical protein
MILNFGRGEKNTIVGIATGDGLTGRGLKFRLGKDISSSQKTVQTVSGAYPSSHSMGTGLLSPLIN